MEFNRCYGCMEDITAYPCPECGYDPANQPPRSFALRPGAILRGKYVVGKVLGQGGFGITYIGWDLMLTRKVAIKEYYPSGQVSRSGTKGCSVEWHTSEAARVAQSSGMETFLKEARKMARVADVPQVVNVLEVFQENETAYIVMDFIQGETLKQHLAKTGPLSWRRMQEIFLPVIQAMEKVHRAELIHRDVSPDNLMLLPDGSVRILDLGAAKDLNLNTGASSMQVAKGGFSPLEQYTQRGGSGTWTDVYALAATIYYALTGSVLPAAVDRMEEDTLRWDHPRLQGLPPKGVGALKKALAIRAKDRTQTMEELYRGIAVPETAKPEKKEKKAGKEEPLPGKPEPAKAEKKKRAKRLLPVGAVVVCALIAAAVLWKPWAKTEKPLVAAAEQTQEPKETQAAPAETTAPVEEEMVFTEAPFLTAAGTYGKVEDRLPVADDVMIESVDAAGNALEIGVYGGELKRSAGGGNWDAGKPIEEGLFRFNTSGTIEPNVAKGYDVNDDYTVYTIYLREGMKWSDGEPFTAEDCVWFYNVVCLNKLDSKGVRACHKDANGDPAVVEKVDDYTFTVTFGTPKYDFPEALTVDLKWHYAPKHILGEMCNKILAGDSEGAIAMGKELTGVEFADTGALGKETMYYFWNYPGIPTLNPFVLSTEAGKNNIKGEYYEFVRNPYYWKVDAKGQQLPYMDKIVYTTVQNVSQTLMLLLDGTVDYQTIAVQDAPTVLDAENTSGTKINLYQWAPTYWGSGEYQLHLNLGIADEQKNALFNNADFRQALSIAVDRVEMAATLTDNWNEPGQAAPQEGAVGYSEEWANQWTEYDPAKAKSLLESAGLVMGSDGFYAFADGSKFELNIVAVADMGAAETFGFLNKYFRAVGIKCNYRDYDRSYIDNELMAGYLECMLFPVTPIGDISIALKPNSMIPGSATNVAWYSTMNEETATGDLKTLIDLKHKLDETGDPDARAQIVNDMMALHQKNQWTIGYIAEAPAIHAVNARIHNFPDGLVWSDIYRDMGIAHCQCWFIQE